MSRSYTLVKARGAVLLETLCLVTLIGVITVGLHQHVIRSWRVKVKQLEEQRIPFDGAPSGQR